MRELTAVKIYPRICEIDAADWNACANPDPATFNPFVTHGFLSALEASGSVGRRAGWIPRHLVLDGGKGGIAAAMPCYLKTHSQGEYVFDHAWADAFERAGGRYYPKLQAAVPFTPVPGPRLMVKTGPDSGRAERLLAAGAIELTRQLGVSSLHITFLDEATARRLQALGFLIRTGQQFHWQNHGYRSFEDFLGTLASRKRKTVRKERIEAVKAGIEIEWLAGREIGETEWDQFFAFYMDTGSRKWGYPYLNRAFFSALGRSMAERCLLILARRAGNPVGGALNLIGGDCLYGRYWGSTEHHAFLHFEVCYYQAIEYAIAHGLRRVEAGAQGEHKLSRGYLPATTYSAHWIADNGLRNAVAQYLAVERTAVAESSASLAEFAPYKKVSFPARR